MPITWHGRKYLKKRGKTSENREKTDPIFAENKLL
jgi:hypothetical protein